MDEGNGSLQGKVTGRASGGLAGRRPDQAVSVHPQGSPRSRRRLASTRASILRTRRGFLHHAVRRILPYFSQQDVR